MCGVFLVFYSFLFNICFLSPFQIRIYLVPTKITALLSGFYGAVSVITTSLKFMNDIDFRSDVDKWYIVIYLLGIAKALAGSRSFFKGVVIQYVPQELMKIE